MIDDWKAFLNGAMREEELPTEDENVSVQKPMDAPGPAEQPFGRRIVRRIVEELFHQQSSWKTQTLVDRAVQEHLAQGGSRPSNPANKVWRVLNDLRHDGLVDNPDQGYWRWTESTRQGSSKAEEVEADAEGCEEGEILDAEADTRGCEEGEIADLAGSLRPEKEVGSGIECVYLYFNPNDRRLAELEGRDVWECKIGRTSSLDAIPRILGQGVRTALSRLPTVGIVLRTDDSMELERALHSSLRLLEAEVPESPGSEWFLTSPARVEAWYALFQDAISALQVASTDSVERANEPGGPAAGGW
jgi:hypothetical protein